MKEKYKLENEIKLIQNQIEENKLISKTLQFTKNNVLQQLDKEVSENYLIHQSLSLIKMKKMIPKPNFHFNSFFNDKLTDSKLSKKADNVEIESKRNIPEEINNSESDSKKSKNERNKQKESESKNESIKKSKSESKNESKSNLFHSMSRKNSKNKYDDYNDFQDLEEFNLNQCE